MLTKKLVNDNNKKNNEGICNEINLEEYEDTQKESDTEDNFGIHTETDKERKEESPTDTDIDENEEIRKETVVEESDDMHTETELTDSNTICLPCKNGDFPTGIHRCIKCQKSVHLFGCSIKNVNSEEGFGESRVCLSCAEKDNENMAEEHWQRKGKSSSLSKSRSVKSYLVSQLGFDKLNLNQKGNGKNQ